MHNTYGIECLMWKCWKMLSAVICFLPNVVNSDIWVNFQILLLIIGESSQWIQHGGRLVECFSHLLMYTETMLSGDWRIHVNWISRRVSIYLNGVKHICSANNANAWTSAVALSHALCTNKLKEHKVTCTDTYIWDFVCVHTVYPLKCSHSQILI